MLEHASQSPADPSEAAASEPLDADREDQRGMSEVAAGWPQDIGEGCSEFDPAALLRATPRSFALRVRGQSMVGADIYDGDVVIGDFVPQAQPGAIVVALIDGDSALKRLIVSSGQPQLISENPNCPDFIPLSELVIQGVVHTIIRRVR